MGNPGAETMSFVAEMFMPDTCNCCGTRKAEVNTGSADADPAPGLKKAVPEDWANKQPAKDFTHKFMSEKLNASEGTTDISVPDSPKEREFAAQVASFKDLPGKLEKLEALFDLCDKDGSGTLDEEEFFVIGKAWTQIEADQAAISSQGSPKSPKTMKYTRKQNRLAFQALASFAENTQEPSVTKSVFRDYYLEKHTSYSDETFTKGCILVLTAMISKDQADNSPASITELTI